MANDYYNEDGTPAQSSNLESSPIRSVMVAVRQGFDKLIGLAANAGKTVRVNAAGTALEASKVTITEPASSATLTIVNGATLTASATATVSGTHSGASSGTNTGDQIATGVANTPAGNIAATTVQAAINELDAEKAALAGSASQNFTAQNLTSAKVTTTPATTEAVGSAETQLVGTQEIHWMPAGGIAWKYNATGAGGNRWSIAADGTLSGTNNALGSLLWFNFTNTNATAGSGCATNLTSNAGYLRMVKYCTASLGASYLSSTGGSIIVGTDDLNNIVFYTNGTFRMSIGNDGGISTQNATGGSKGIDTINAKGFYRDGVNIAQTFRSTEITVATGNQIYSAAHGFGTVPNEFDSYLVCKTASEGYAVGDVIHLHDGFGVGGTLNFNADSTNVYMLQNASISVLHKATLNGISVTYANWNLVLTARKFI